SLIILSRVSFVVIGTLFLFIKLVNCFFGSFFEIKNSLDTSICLVLSGSSKKISPPFFNLAFISIVF
ncbi:hypothetical protein ACXWQP_09580, partial [Streptococcus pyogenes]